MNLADVVTEKVMPGNEYGTSSIGNCMCGGSVAIKMV
jgi:hypothetical protein